MQCKDIPELPILKFLYSHEEGNGWCNWFDLRFPNSVKHAFPEEIRNTKLVLAKMRQMIKKGLVNGCPCGCRGDFHLTQKGKDYLKLLTSGDCHIQT
jgi:hypothetical protein